MGSKSRDTLSRTKPSGVKPVTSVRPLQFKGKRKSIASKSSEKLVELELASHKPRLSDHEYLVALSTSRIAFFEFLDPIPTTLPASEIIEHLWSDSSICREANLAFISFYGLPNSESALGLPLSKFFPTNTVNAKIFAEWASNNFTLANHEVWSTSPQGEQVAIQISLYTIFENEKIQKLWVIIRDITRIRRAIEELQAAEHHYRTLVERPGLVLVRAKPDGTYLYISPHVEELLGYSPDSFRNDPDLFRQLLHPEDVDRHEAIYAARKSHSHQIVEVEFRVKRKDGTYNWFFERQTPKFDSCGMIEYYDSVAFDIQDRKLLEAELAHAQKMELIGTLAGGIAHDFNNHLTAILGQLTLCLKELPSSGILFNRLAAAEQAALCCAEITQQLLSLGRANEPSMTPLDLHELLSEIESLLRHTLPSYIDLNVDTSTLTRSLKANSTQLRQVIMNLAINARDAMPKGGEIYIQARDLNLTSASERNDFPEAPAGQYIEILVRDNGAGIPRSHLPHIFEPFFTTKGGQGTGLGLSMVYSIVRSHGAWIHVESDQSRGAAFRILFPAQAALAANQKLSNQTRVTQGSEHILVAEDDELILPMVRSALTLHGYTVHCARNGEEAIKIFCDHAHQISLALIDQTMPKLTGREVISQIRTMNPDLPIMLTSGYGAIEAEGQPLNLKRAEFIAKPYSLLELLSNIRKLLDDDPPAN